MNSSVLFRYGVHVSVKRDDEEFKQVRKWIADNEESLADMLRTIQAGNKETNSVWPLSMEDLRPFEIIPADRTQTLLAIIDLQAICGSAIRWYLEESDCEMAVEWWEAGIGLWHQQARLPGLEYSDRAADFGHALSSYAIEILSCSHSSFDRLSGSLMHMNPREHYLDTIRNEVRLLLALHAEKYIDDLMTRIYSDYKSEDLDALLMTLRERIQIEKNEYHEQEDLQLIEIPEVVSHYFAATLGYLMRNNETAARTERNRRIALLAYRWLSEDFEWQAETPIRDPLTGEFLNVEHDDHAVRIYTDSFDKRIPLDE